MDATKGNLNTSETGKNVSIERKAYTTPQLTSYGDISELVLMMSGDGGTDGGLKFAQLT